jgi:hypothetical protein
MTSGDAEGVAAADGDGALLRVATPVATVALPLAEAECDAVVVADAQSDDEAAALSAGREVTPPLGVAPADASASAEGAAAPVGGAVGAADAEEDADAVSLPDAAADGDGDALAAADALAEGDALSDADGAADDDGGAVVERAALRVARAAEPDAPRDASAVALALALPLGVVPAVALAAVALAPDERDAAGARDAAAAALSAAAADADDLMLARAPVDRLERADTDALAAPLCVALRHSLTVADAEPLAEAVARTVGAWLGAAGALGE